MQFQTYAFDELTPRQLHAIYQLRVAVFVVEQKCAYQEVDAIDLTARHLLGTNAQGELVAYARLMPAPNHQARFGRVAVRQDVRGSGNGRRLVQQAIKEIQARWPQTTQIKIAAQHYVESFYASFGFQTVSAVYLEDGIAHQDMVLALS